MGGFFSEGPLLGSVLYSLHFSTNTEKSPVSSSFIRALIPSWGLCSQDLINLISLTKATPPNSITLGVRSPTQTFDPWYPLSTGSAYCPRPLPQGGLLRVGNKKRVQKSTPESCPL